MLQKKSIRPDENKASLHSLGQNKGVCSRFVTIAHLLNFFFTSQNSGFHHLKHTPFPEYWAKTGGSVLGNWTF